MEINDLVIFTKVAEVGSISKAAEQLGYVQPNITGRLKILESELNKPLFRRTNKGVVLLPAGEILFDYATKILNLMNESKEKILNLNPLLKIGATQTITKNYLSNLLINNNLKFSIYTRPTEELLFLLKTYKIDVVVINKEWQNSKIELLHSFNEKIGWLGSKEIKLKNFKNISVLVNRDKDCPYRKATLNFLEKVKNNWNVIEIDSLDLILSMLEYGEGIAILPKKMCTNKIVEHSVEGLTLEDVKIYLYKKNDNNKVNNQDFKKIFD
ncbi:LysR family transcriptional regulator [Clostridium estertheticum]|uniref:LysR family transcriptional regulator n=1 Tax=Clostridium estertheticum TaxID=238834 RepID=UPI001C0D13F5|nr:LysR family transcriptional regulator [Clostridium estertheticum]MBU3076022.1 LysR family transcriptional regulator [Clostridium estertheticum]MBU3166142.1 LysR family transcriptional regulator [Clostridium estertheticum]